MLVPLLRRSRQIQSSSYLRIYVSRVCPFNYSVLASDGSFGKVPARCYFRIRSAMRSFTYDPWISELTQTSQEFSGCVRIAPAGAPILIREKYGSAGTFVPLTAHSPNG